MFGFLIPIIGFIWNALQGFADISIEVLAFAVSILQTGAATMAGVIRDGFDVVRGGFNVAWDFLKTTYDDVLKPAWNTFWGWFDKLRTWLDTTFGPILKFLQRVRDALLKYWNMFVRPWLDLIDVTRKGLSVLASLGVSWAKALDARLTAIEQAIEKPFLFILAQLNGVINVVNKVVTADGLIQRVALIRSLAANYQLAWKAIVAPYSTSIDDIARGDLKTSLNARTLDDITADFENCLDGGDGPVCVAATHATALLKTRWGQ
jgi:hypothetical protein